MSLLPNKVADEVRFVEFDAKDSPMRMLGADSVDVSSLVVSEHLKQPATTMVEDEGQFALREEFCILQIFSIFIRR